MSCGVCGGVMVSIRGRISPDPRREVCPTCLAERMDMINEMSARNYGMAYESEPSEPKRCQVSPQETSHEGKGE